MRVKYGPRCNKALMLKASMSHQSLAANLKGYGMSVGNLPSPSQQQYDAMMAAANAFVANANGLDLDDATRQSEDCQRILTLIQAATNVYNTYCDI